MNIYILGLLLFLQCQSPEKINTIHLITLDPGHFHSALVQKSMYEKIDPTVHIYAPDTPDLLLHLKKIDDYNSRLEKPTNWNTLTYKGSDYQEKMLYEKKGNVVMLSGNNQRKTGYILAAIKNGFHVYADKPLAITSKDFNILKEAFLIAEKKGLLLYDIMTERSEITTLLQKELSQTEDLFGNLIEGTQDKPAITKESVHHYYKYVSGKPLIRPAWFFDTEQQGEGIADVTSHLVDLTFWECFPERTITTSDIKLITSKRWPTLISAKDFSRVTGERYFPDYLQKNIVQDSLEVYANGSINYTIKGHYAKVSVKWEYEAKEGSGDNHFSIMRGTKANLIIEQGVKQNFTPTLYIKPIRGGFNEASLRKVIDKLQNKYPGISVLKEENKFKIIIPKYLREGHEAHFSEVTKRFIKFYEDGKIPNWESTNMLTKYWLTTSALKMAKENK